MRPLWARILEVRERDGGCGLDIHRLLRLFDVVAKRTASQRNHISNLMISNKNIAAGGITIQIEKCPVYTYLTLEEEQLVAEDGNGVKVALANIRNPG